MATSTIQETRSEQQPAIIEKTRHRAPLSILVVAGALAGAMAGWLSVNVGIALDHTGDESSAFDILSTRLAESSGALFEFVVLMIAFTTAGACAAYGLSVHKRISEQKNLVENAIEAERSKNIFISMLLHFIRTPLAGIRWSLDTMRARPDVDVANKHQIDVLYEETLRALDAVEHLIDVSRASTGNIAYKVERVTEKDILACVDYAVADVRRQAEVKHLNIITQQDPPSDRAFSADRSKIQIAVQTLLENAINYTAEGGKITVRTSASRDFFRCAVSDSGIGIPASDQKKIFTQFYRSENARRERAVGFGVGLYMTKLFIEKHGGKIWFESEEGVGTTFIFEIPFLKANGDR